MHQNEERQHKPPVNPFLCTRCGDRFPSYRPFIEHAKAHQLLDEEEPKDSIGSQQLSRSGLPVDNAEFKQMEIKEENNNSFVCIECDALFSSYKLLMDHKKSHQFIDEKGSVLQEQIREKVREQVSQGKMLDRGGARQDITNSEKDKTGNYKCDNCNYSFKSSGFLSRHLKDEVCVKAGIKRPHTISEPRFKDNKKLRKAWNDGKPIPGKKNTMKNLDIDTTSSLDTISMNNEVKVIQPDIMGVHLEKLLCRKCEKYFSTLSNLRRHVRDSHPDVAQVKVIKSDVKEVDPEKLICKNCAKSFSSLSNRNKHVRDFHSEHSKDRVIKRDMEEVDLEKLVCKKCGKSFSSLSNLKKHVRDFHSEDCKFHCKKCKMSFKVAEKLEQHLRYKICTHPGRSRKSRESPDGVAKQENDRDEDLEKSGKVLAENCLNKEEYAEQIDCSGRFSQPIAVQQKAKVEELVDLPKSLVKSAPVNPKKEEGVSIKENLDVKPLERKHSDQSLDLKRKDGKHRCNHCGWCFKRKDYLVKHLKEKVCTLPKEMREVNLKKEPRFKCKKCHLTFYYSVDFAQHSVDEHSDLKPFPCNSCGAKYSTDSYLKKHIVKKHEDFCSKCKMRFPDGGLHDHIQEEHGSHICEVCFKSFLYVGQLERHIMTHSNARPFACNACKKTYKYKDDLTVHMRVHLNQQSDKAEKVDQQSDKIGKSEKQCDKAGKSDQQSDKEGTQIRRWRCSNRGRKPKQIKDLPPPKMPGVPLRKPWRERKTMMTVTERRTLIRQRKPIKGEPKSTNLSKPQIWACKICKKVFSSQKEMYGHKREEHPESLHKCEICSWAFCIAGQLKRHMSVHSEERPFECDICDCRYKRKEDLKVHKRCHGGN